MENITPELIIGTNPLELTACNVDSFSDGVFMFDSLFGRAYIGSNENFIQMAVVKDRIVYIGRKNELVAVPGIDGFILCFSGEKAISSTKDIQIGQIVKAKYFDIKSGNDVSIKTAKNIYEFTTMKLGGLNCPRSCETVVIYNSAYGISTNTGEYGYEILVDKNGVIIDDNGFGNSVIPDGGYVMAGAGYSGNKLMNAYNKGAKVYVNNEKNTISVVFSPMSAYKTALEKAERLREEVKFALYKTCDFVYKKSQELLDVIDESARMAEFLDESMVANGAGALDGSMVANGAGALDRKAEENSINKGLENNRSSEDLNENDLSYYRNSVIEKTEDLYNLLIPSPVVEDRGAWHVISERNEDDVRRTVEAALELGLNYIIVDTWSEGFAYFHTKLEGVQINERYKDFDLLAAFVKIGHEYGLKIHSSVSVFMAGGIKREYPSGHPTLREGWVTKSRNGNNYGINGDGEFYTLDPHNPEVRAYMMNVMREVAQNYDIDGIHYDYIRFPQPHPDTGDFGYNEGLVKAFREKYNTDINPADITEDDELYIPWCEFRCDLISSFVKECTTMIKRINSNIMVTAAVFAGMEQMKTSIFQDPRKWLDGGYIDGIFPMLYTPSIISFEKYGKRAIDATKNRAYLNMGIGTFGFYPIENILRQIEYSRENNAGVCFFTLDSLLKTKYKKFISEGAFKRRAVTTDSENSFTVLVNDLIRRIDEVYLPASDNPSSLNKLKKLLENMEETDLDWIIVYCENKFDKTLLDRILETLLFLKRLTVKKGFNKALIK